MNLHRSILRTHVLSWPDPSACEAVAQALATSPAVRDALITLHGPLGAGKTTFARALLRALGVTGRIKSPTYALLEPYDVNGWTIAHIDLYRMNHPDEWAGAGLRDTLAADGLKLIEWPERAGGGLPLADLSLTIEVLDGDDALERGDRADGPGGASAEAQPARRVTLQAHTDVGGRLLGDAMNAPVPGDTTQAAA